MPDPNHGGFTPSDRVNHATAIGSAKAAARGSHGGGVGWHGSPLFGMGQAAHEIIEASGLGRRTPQGASRGEKMSDADGPKQEVKVDESGARLRQTPKKDHPVHETGIGHYDTSGAGMDYRNLVHDSMPTSLSELEDNLGIPAQFMMRGY